MSEQDEIVEVKGVPLIVKGGDRDITVKISELEHCITAIRKLKEYKASLMLEQIVARGSTPPAAPVADTSITKLYMEAAKAYRGYDHDFNGDGLMAAVKTVAAALSASPSPGDGRDAREEPDTDAAELIALINNRIGSQFDDEATFSATEALRIMIALERRVAE